MIGRGISRGFVTVLGASSLLTLASIGHADDASSNRAAARELGVQGVLLAEKGKCGEAIEKLEHAERLYHAPTTLERLGECKVEVGRIVDGTEDLQRVVKEDLPAGAPAAFTAAKARAAGILKKATPRIAHLRVHVNAPTDVKPAVTMDGLPFPDVALDGDRPVDPGTHNFAATADGMIRAETTVSLGEAESKSIELKLVADPNAVKPTQISPPLQTDQPKPPPPDDDHKKPPPPPPESPSHVPAYIAFGVGIAGVGVGTVTGILALGKKSTLDNVCGASKTGCPSSSQSDIDSAKTMGTISTVGFIVGGVGVAAGIVLLLTEGSSSNATATVGSVRVSPDLGAGFVGAHGSF
ncbi:MAG: hypothetical protein ABI183_05030 [Polyangiaceae bacterium]